MSESEQNTTEFTRFVDDIKSKIAIDKLYTELTGECFSKSNGRLRAKIAWREDKNPSLCYSDNKNLLTDFTDSKEGSDKSGVTYNVLDILMKCGGAVNYWHALQMACEKIGNKEEFQKFCNLKNLQEKDFTGLSILGSKVAEVWRICRAHLFNKARTPIDRPPNMNKFFKHRNMPFDESFLESINIGMVPTYDEIFNLLKGKKILPKSKKGESGEINIFRPEFENNALVFPLYNLDGALCGLRFRRMDEKEFAEWMPFKQGCFYNAQRFKKYTKTGKRLNLVEGEMNVVAYAISAFNVISKKFKNDKEIVSAMDVLLSTIFATGSKSNSVVNFSHRVKSLLYFQDHDMANIDQDTSPKDHSILKTCLKVDKEINADEIQIVDWEACPKVKVKYDLENYLSDNDYSLESMSRLTTMGIPRYAVTTIDRYCNSFTDNDTRRELRVKYSGEIGRLFISNGRRELFNAIAKERFQFDSEEYKFKIIEPDLAECVYQKNNKKMIYTIDHIGRIMLNEMDENGDGQESAVTSFYLRVNKETTYFGSCSDDIRKKAEIEVIVNGRKAKSFEVDVKALADTVLMREHIYTQLTLNGLEYYDDSIISDDRKFREVVLGLMHRISLRGSSFMFSQLGRPCHNWAQDECAKLLKTDLYCLMPGFSVIDGKVIKNTNIDINIQHDKMNFKFADIDKDDYRKAGNLFWNDLRKIHDPNIMDSLIAQMIDSCTRELQAYGIVESDHGFPIYLSGASGSYKTTAAMGAMSLVGDFKNQNQLLSWHGTALSIEHQLISIGTLTHCVDDLKLEDMSARDFVSFFHAIYGGGTKTKMNGNTGEMKGGRKFGCSVIITSETENTNIPESIAARMLVLRVNKCDSETSEKRKAHIENLYVKYHDKTSLNIDLMRAFMPKIVAWAQIRGGDKYKEYINKWKKHFFEEVAEKRNNIERPSDMAARILAAFETLCDFMLEEHFATKEEAECELNRLVKFWDAQLPAQVKRIENQSSINKTVSLIWQLIKTERIAVKRYTNGRWVESSGRTPYGGIALNDVTYGNGERKLLIVSSTLLVKYMNELLAKNENQIMLSKFVSDLQEIGVIEKTLYPIPTEHTEGWEDTKNRIPAIDYEKMLEIFGGIQND